MNVANNLFGMNVSFRDLFHELKDKVSSTKVEGSSTFLLPG